jgi:hypothetical protein
MHTFFYPSASLSISSLKPFHKSLSNNLPNPVLSGLTQHSFTQLSNILRHIKLNPYPTLHPTPHTTPSQTLTGSRSGGLIAQCWASLVSIGEEGYLRHTKEIMDTTQVVARGVEAIRGLKLLGSCEAMIVCFAGDFLPGMVYFAVVSV